MVMVLLALGVAGIFLVRRSSHSELEGRPISRWVADLGHDRFPARDQAAQVLTRIFHACPLERGSPLASLVSLK